jgi:hypothetical protein
VAVISGCIGIHLTAMCGEWKQPGEILCFARIFWVTNLIQSAAGCAKFEKKKALSELVK